VHAAKVNSAAIHYHFGTREGLITAIMEQRHPMWRPQRIAMVEALEQRDQITARDVVVAMVEPVAALMAYPWGQDYINFLADVASHPRYALIVHTVGDDYRPSYLKQFARVTPHLPEHIRLARFSYLHEFVYHALASGNRRVALWLSSIGESPESWTTDDFIDMIAGAITAPVHEA
jgi:AcrR family transcriptional regulator